MRPKRLDRAALDIKSLSGRAHDLTVSVVSNLKMTHSSPPQDRRIHTIAERIICAKENRSSVILMMGAHVIRAGVQRYLIDLMEKGYISCIALNGGGMIHDFELALAGATTESVARYIKNGQFGLWKETARLNDIINEAYEKDKNTGMGEAVGRHIEDRNLPHKSVSILAAGHRLHIPVTVHVGIGYDIIHEHPNCDGAATGALSYNDFLTFASAVEGLEGGVVMNFGSATMAPEVFLKALSMARNIAHQHDRKIRHYSALVCDLATLPGDISKEPPKKNPGYYFRPWKTMLVRTVADGGEGFYVRGKHARTIPSLWANINKLETEIGKDNRNQFAGGRTKKA